MLLTIKNWAAFNPRHDYKSTPWFRCEAKVFRSKSLDDLSVHDKWVWICLLGLACEENKRGLIEATSSWIARQFGMTNADEPSPELVNSILALEKKGLIELKNSDLRPCGDREPIMSRSHDDRESIVPRSLRNGTNVTERNDTNGTSSEQEAAAPAPGNDQVPDGAEGKPDSFTARQFIDAWNAHRGELAEVKRLTRARSDKIATRRGEEPSLDYWVLCFQRMAASDFLTGKNNRGWKADIEWLTENDTNHVKVSEGKYDNRAAKQPTNPDRDRGMAPGYVAEWVTSEGT